MLKQKTASGKIACRSGLPLTHPVTLRVAPLHCSYPHEVLQRYSLYFYFTNNTL